MSAPLTRGTITPEITKAKTRWTQRYHRLFPQEYVTRGGRNYPLPWEDGPLTDKDCPLRKDYCIQVQNQGGALYISFDDYRLPVRPGVKLPDPEPGMPERAYEDDVLAVMRDLLLYRSRVWKEKNYRGWAYMEAAARHVQQALYILDQTHMKHDIYPLTGLEAEIPTDWGRNGNPFYEAMELGGSVLVQPDFRSPAEVEAQGRLPAPAQDAGAEEE